MSIIRSGVFIENIEVTSEHIGKRVRVIHDGNKYQPFGFVTTIDGVYDGDFDILDNNGHVRGVHTSNQYEWVDHPSKKPEPAIYQDSTKQQRQDIADSIRQYKAQLDDALKAAKEMGMTVATCEDGSVKINFQPPLEEY